VTYARQAKAVWFRMDLAGRGRAPVPGRPLASVPGPSAVAVLPAENGTARDALAPRARSSVGASGLDDLLVSAVGPA
jgi:hypothetical protein